MIQNRPPPGSMVYWKWKNFGPPVWRFGYCTYAGSYDMVRMGSWAGDSTGGSVVSIVDIEWKAYQ